MTYKKTDPFDFDFGDSLLGDPPVRCVDYGNIVREAESFSGYSQSITRAVRKLLGQGTVPVVIGGDHGTTIPVLRAYEDVEDLCVVQIDAHLERSYRSTSVRLAPATGKAIGYNRPLSTSITAAALRTAAISGLLLLRITACHSSLQPADAKGEHRTHNQIHGGDGEPNFDGHIGGGHHLHGLESEFLDRNDRYDG